MDYLQIGTIFAGFTFALAIGRIIWRLADRINKVEDAADVAGLNATAAKLDVEMLASDVNKHRVEIAKEYVTSRALESLESKLIEAINRLGDRLDRLFQQHQ